MPPRSILPREHAEDEEDQQHRRAQSARHKAGEDADHTQHATDEDELVGALHVLAAKRQQVGSDGHAGNLVTVQGEEAMMDCAH